MNKLVTGAAGFIGFYLTQRLLLAGHTVIGVDNLNDYYDVSLKNARLKLLQEDPNFQFHNIDIADYKAIHTLFQNTRPERVYHLAAQAGVRYSLTHPFAYTHSNIEGFLSILEACRHNPVAHLVYASSSSVYGANDKIPFKVNDDTDHPISLYAATKKSNELMASTYSHLYNIKATGLRFFTVYGPWGRPDMAYFSFVKKIISGESITIFNKGQHQRDFTYIDDIVEGVVRVGESSPSWGHRIFNIGNSNPIWLMDFLNILEKLVGKKANYHESERVAGDVLNTGADVSDLENEYGFRPSTPIETGLKKFVDWYKDYYKI